ncbi:MAG: peptide deformylase [Chloroflexi bacterium]|nr:peptide deformylase [Chloroflexota bacterium]
MALLEILLADDPILRQKSKKVRQIDSSIQRLMDDMLETMHDAHGVGLAAPQVGQLLRVIVIHLPEQEPLALVNPEVVKREGQRVVEEGCLSIPGWRGEVTRSVTVTVKALNRHGKQIRIKAAEDLLAQALEHEIDHLDGVLYIDHLTRPDKLWKIPPREEEGSPEEPEPALVG